MVLRLSLIILALLGMAACQGGKSKKPASPTTALRKMKGDPMTMVKDTRMNGNAAMPSGLLKDGEKWNMTFRGFFEAETEVAQPDLETGNEAPEEEIARTETESQYRFTVVKTETGFTLASDTYQFDFSIQEDQQVKVTRFGAPGGTHPIDEIETFKILHTSAKHDLSAFSLLAYSTDEGKRSLIEFGFTHPVELPDSLFTKEAFYYMFGKGVKIGWSQERQHTLTFCGSPTAVMSGYLQDGLGMWQPYLKNRLRFKSELRESCPPFSDLNVHSLHFVTDWIEIEGEHGTAGVNAPFRATPDGEYVDSDIFIYLAEFDEARAVHGKQGKVTDEAVHANYQAKAQLTGVFAHEIGHLLGLHHQFDDSVPSIMGYKGLNELQPYDIQAIQALYPLVTRENATALQ